MKSRFLPTLVVAFSVRLSTAEEPAPAPATHIHLLDEPGVPQKGELQP